jgi:hypothetical protein
MQGNPAELTGLIGDLENVALAFRKPAVSHGSHDSRQPGSATPRLWRRARTEPMGWPVRQATSASDTFPSKASSSRV